MLTSGNWSRKTAQSNSSPAESNSPTPNVCLVNRYVNKRKAIPPGRAPADRGDWSLRQRPSLGGPRRLDPPYADTLHYRYLIRNLLEHNADAAQPGLA